MAVVLPLACHPDFHDNSYVAVGQFWDAAMRFPPTLEAFEQHGGVSKLLYLLLPTAGQVGVKAAVCPPNFTPSEIITWCVWEKRRGCGCL